MIYHYCDINDTGYQIYVNYKPDPEVESVKLRSPGMTAMNEGTGVKELVQTRGPNS